MGEQRLDTGVVMKSLLRQCQVFLALYRNASRPDPSHPLVIGVFYICLIQNLFFITEVLQNGQESTTGSDAIEDVATKDLSPLLDETAVVLSNGSAEGEAETNHIASELNTFTSGTTEPVVVSDGTIATALLGYVHTQPGLTPDASQMVDDEDEGILVMRAERVILTDEDLPPQGQEEEEEEESGPLNMAQGEAEGETMAKVETAPLETSASAPHGEECERSEALDTVAAEAGVSTGDADSNKEGAEGVADGEPSAPTADPSLQSPAGTVGGSTVASVPIYSQAPPSPLSPRPGPEGETGTEQAGAPAAAAAPGDGASELASLATAPAALPSHFQEVPLAEVRSPGAGPGPGEQEPLLGQAKAPQTKAGGPGVAGAHGGPPAGAEAHATARAVNRGGEEGVSPKSKTCQCCSVM
ncbi:hypothetical protein N1851_022901 [Merluccius polli]|uniref:Uncharacterized protein n=1 Tax=Merluccius polli TaxID=89951 RepID=A0AA47NVG7_MERPO|nr:hypothetical protein N1851_022901 [Merluccius polli]